MKSITFKGTTVSALKNMCGGCESRVHRHSRLDEILRSYPHKLSSHKPDIRSSSRGTLTTWIRTLDFLKQITIWISTVICLGADFLFLWEKKGEIPHPISFSLLALGGGMGVSSLQGWDFFFFFFSLCPASFATTKIRKIFKSEILYNCSHYITR